MPIQQLTQLVNQLRHPQKGDPWILEQTFDALAELTIEEAYEFAEAVARENPADMADELGDLLLHIVLYAKIADEAGVFNLETVIQATLDKQNRRKLDFHHPESVSAAQALALWERKKAAERPAKKLLDDCGKHFPTLSQALKMQTKAASVGFDFDSATPIYKKIQEELVEFQQACQVNDKASMEIELGDILFSVVNLARHFDIHPESALRKANLKFKHRFENIELSIKGNFKAYSVEQLEALWQKFKTSQDKT